MRILYDQQNRYVDIMASRTEALEFSQHLRSDGSVMVAGSIESLGEYIGLGCVRFYVRDTGRLMISVSNRELIVSAGRDFLEGFSVIIKEFVEASPINRGFHYENRDNSPAFEKDSLGMILDLV